MTILLAIAFPGRNGTWLNGRKRTNGAEIRAAEVVTLNFEAHK